MKYDIGVVGLGFVGLTLAASLADRGYSVIGVEKRQDLCDQINRSEAPFLEPGLGELLSKHALGASGGFPVGATCQTYIICVGTPANSHAALESAAREVAANMPDGSLVIVRSTVKVGDTRKIVAPILAGSGKTFDIAVCPERTVEGDALRELRALPQIIGADTVEARERAHRLFSSLGSHSVFVSSMEAAETVKLLANGYRDVMFGFANEIALFCEKAGLSAREVIHASNFCYERTQIARPGPVGGPCMEKDPHLLADSMRAVGVRSAFMAASRGVNEQLPREAAGVIHGELRRRGIQDPAIAFVGIAFKGSPETDDCRGSMAVQTHMALNDILGAPVKAAYFDSATDHYPDVSDIRGGRFDLIVLCNNHHAIDEFGLDCLMQSLSPQGFMYDYWPRWPKAANYLGLGL